MKMQKNNWNWIIFPHLAMITRINPTLLRIYPEFLGKQPCVTLAQQNRR